MFMVRLDSRISRNKGADRQHKIVHSRLSRGSTGKAQAGRSRAACAAHPVAGIQFRSRHPAAPFPLHVMDH
jgi:hypothetical protein